MNNHFEINLCVRDMILDKRPKYIVELGAGDGQNTRQILSLRDIFPFKLTTISTGKCPPDIKHDDFRWINGVSYVELWNIPEGIELCSIDTDHNYWTLKQELNALKDKVAHDCLIVLHDTETYALHDGTQNSYDENRHVEYPSAIANSVKKGLQAAIFEFLMNSDFRLYKHTYESAGATALIRGF